MDFRSLTENALTLVLSPIGMGEGNFPKQADQMCVSFLPSPTCGEGRVRVPLCASFLHG